MFDFEKYDAELREKLKTSYGRFWNRLEEWQRFAYRQMWTTTKAGSPERLRALKRSKWIVRKFHLIHHFWWFVHNVICHPLIGLCPIKPFFDFHDYTSRKINAPKEED